MRTEQKSKTALIKELRSYRRDYNKLVSDWSEQIQKRVQAEQLAAELGRLLEERRELNEKQERLIAMYQNNAESGMQTQTAPEHGRHKRHLWQTRRRRPGKE